VTETIFLGGVAVLSFHANLLAPPQQEAAGPLVSLRGLDLTTLVAPGGGPPHLVETFDVTFEQARDRLLAIPRTDFEPDGYFLITGSSPRRWQVDGHLFEYQEKLHRMELHGSCPAQVFDDLLSAVGWPEAKVVFQLVQEGVTLREVEFRLWAALAENSPEGAA
jgi:hypothetical protein